ncbi:WXG100 family type VII secretion target [Streptomyces sp. TLI_171]|uniref:WXG100 family type VII secretion target n=1 Tax=Streptomyces sp. TLI_171 TaxID=1938859 RepID=UPI000C5B3BC1|nr:PPE domain-containing protein [Streptomyces sp. TLI_171]RKE19260.1 PPE family protein [Streptomyces sp. TLI_171]
MSEFTSFTDYSHGQMRSMVQAMDSGAVMAAADPWRRATDTLKQIRTALNTAAADATDSWQGSTSDAFYTRMTSLANNVNNAAAYANDAAGALQMMSEAIDKAKRDMPEEPGFWDKAGDSLGDFAQQSVGINTEESRTSIADTRKQEAVGVMEVLATSYRSATNYLQVPTWGRRGDERELTPPDNGGASALGALIAGAGMGLAQSSAGTGGSSGSKVSGQRTVTSSTPKAPKVQPTVVRPTDAGISGGTANALPQPKGPGTGIDGVQGGTVIRGGAGQIGGTSGAGAVHGPSGGGGFGLTSGGSAAGLGGHGEIGMGGGTGIGGSRAGFSGNSVSKAGTFGAGGMGGSGGLGGGAGEGGAGGGAGGRAGRGLTGKAGGVVGESTHAASGGRAFSEGGSGIGRSRFGQGGGAGQAGGPGQAGAGHGGGMAGHGQAGKKDKKRGKDRPDYLVEDEETWASGNHVNPDVVE